MSGTTNGHAVVVGASMAGLAATAAVAERARRVTLVDRDRLPKSATPRRGVPQDRHLHLLLPAGATALEALLPGLLDDLGAGDATLGGADRVRMSINGHRLARARPDGSDVSAVFAARTDVEAHVRGRVRDLPGVEVREGHVVRGLVTDASGGRVTGVRVARVDDGDDEEVLDADLVVDCSGRGSRTPAWLAALGHSPPAVDELPVDVRYATQAVRLDSNALDGDRHVLVAPTSSDPRGAAMTHVGPDRWLVTLFAMAGARPPTDHAGMQSFAHRLPIADIGDALEAGEPLGEPAAYRFPAHRWHRYDRSPDLPDRLLVAGDAVCSFNPVYGQGMTVAAVEAVRLRDLLRRGRPPSPREWFAEIRPIVRNAWDLATGADLAVDAVDGPRPLPVRVANGYLRRLHAAATRDRHLVTRFARVVSMLDPPSALLRPSVVARVVAGGRPER